MRHAKLWAALYGLAFHAVVAAVVIWTAARNQADIPTSFWWSAVPPFLVAAAAVYAFVVGPYLPRRPTTRSALLWDSSIGMLAEVCVLAATSILFAFTTSTGALAGGAGAYLVAVASRATSAFLFSVGSFFLQLLVVGNAAGLLGFWVLKKVNAARASRQA